MKTNKKIAIVCCSNGQKHIIKKEIDLLTSNLQEMGLEPVLSQFIYEKDGTASGTAMERAAALMDFYKDETIEAIFDISGGDIANEILPYLDFNIIAAHPVKFWGYSDLTTIINAIYAKTGNPSVLYHIKNIIHDGTGTQYKNFYSSFVNNTNDLFKFRYKFIQGNHLEGTVTGGNIRCFLKLAGTPYFPDTSGKILFLESRNGKSPQMITYLAQLKQTGVLDNISGIILGTFTEMEETGCKPDIISLLKRYIKPDMPVVKTSEIGHSRSSKAIVIGRDISLDLGRV